MPHEQTGQPQTPGKKEKRPVLNRIIVAGVLLIVAFLAGFLPSYSKGKRLESELREARRENTLAQLRDSACLAYLQASQKDYGLAAGTSRRLFARTREVANQTPDPSGRKPLEDLLSVRDQITTKLASGDPGVLSDLQALLVKTRQATAIPAGAPQLE
jgi:flagellar basal body-associated protein FliL